MLNKILRFRTVLMLLLGLSLFCPGVFAQGHQEGRHGGHNGSTINRGYGHGSRHYYHNGNWNRNGWYGWGIPGPVYSNGLLVSSLPPDYTAVVVGGNPYFYGNGTYFRQMPSGGFVVVTLAN